MKIALLVALCSLSLACCTTSRPVAEAEAAATSRSTSVSLDSLAQLPAYLVPAPAGSSPRQRRQWQKAQATNLARAGVGPAKVKIQHSSVATGPGAVATTISKPKAPVATAPGSTATDARKAGQRGGAGAVGEGATATDTTESGLSYWWLLVPLVGLLYWQRKRLALLF